MKNFNWFKQIANNGKLERRLSLGEYKRAASWSKYIVSSGAAIKGEGEEEWSADMSQLYIGNKFASGRHSRIYRGVYKHRDVAIKLISQPEEDGDLATFLEKQFTSEVALLLRLKHPNIITVSKVYLFSVGFLLIYVYLVCEINCIFWTKKLNKGRVGKCGTKVFQNVRIGKCGPKVVRSCK